MSAFAVSSERKIDVVKHDACWRLRPKGNCVLHLAKIAVRCGLLAMVHAIKVILAVALGWTLVLVLAVVLPFTRWREIRRRARHPAGHMARPLIAGETDAARGRDQPLSNKAAEDGLAVR